MPASAIASPSVRGHRRFARVLIQAMLVAAVSLAGCGGGGSSATFELTAFVGGQNMGNYGPGTGTLYVQAGQSFELDANEPVFWTLYVGNTAITSPGTDVFYRGVDIRLTAESASRIAVDTFASTVLSSSVPITLVATSTIDAAQVATVDVFITN